MVKNPLHFIFFNFDVQSTKNSVLNAEKDLLLHGKGAFHASFS